MDEATRRLVRERAMGRCEYCGLPQTALPLSSFHIEHVVAKQHGGEDFPENLALASHHCNLHKGPNLTGIDAETGAIALLFHPRREVWAEHFAAQGVFLIGLTPTARATVRTLAMNAESQIEARSSLGS